MELDIDLTEMDLARDYRARDIPDSTALADAHSDQIGMKWDVEALAALCADAGRQALAGEPGPIQDAAVLGTALTLWHVGKAENLKEAARLARQAIASGAALERLEAGL
jgi:anthranilate phosphoribosyltransferase